jgi:hypothetical protein
MCQWQSNSWLCWFDGQWLKKKSMWNDHRPTPQQKQTISLNMDTKSTNWKGNIQNVTNVERLYMLV